MDSVTDWCRPCTALVRILNSRNSPSFLRTTMTSQPQRATNILERDFSNIRNLVPVTHLEAAARAVSQSGVPLFIQATISSISSSER